MVKGVARHAVIVRSPELKDVEQAIFIMSGEGREPQIKSQAEMLALASRLAYSEPAAAFRPQAARNALACALWFLAGCITAGGALWLLSAFAI